MFKHFNLIFFLITGHLMMAQVDFKKVDAYIEIDTIQASVSGKVKYQFEVLHAVDSLLLDAKKMSFYEVMIDNNKVKHKITDTHLIIQKKLTAGNYELTFDYHAIPQKALYFFGWNGTDNSQLWTQGQGKYTSNWFPSFDNESEKLVFSLDIAFDQNYEVISNGILTNKEKLGDKYIWSYQMKKPMSSYLLMIAIGKFNHDTLTSNSGIPIELYYSEKDNGKVEPTYRYSREIFDFFEKEIGFSYPWEVYRNIPIKDFVYAGMENTTSTLFSREYMVDSLAFNDQNFVNINAHELAHQWFGNVVTAASSKHHWLHEGFATYYALLAEKELFGEDYFYWELFKYATEIQEASNYDTIPLLDGKASSLTFYKKGAWALHSIYSKIGREDFNKAVFNYLETNKYQVVTTDDFINAVKAVAEFDDKEFSSVWLEKHYFPEQEIYDLLFQSQFIQDYVSAQKLRIVPFSDKKERLVKIIESDAYYPIKQEVIYQLEGVPFKSKKELLKAVIEQNNPHLDLVLAAIESEIEPKQRVLFEKLLSSKSYRAREIAMLKLWEFFPEYAPEYLEKMKGIEGLGNKNIELLWLYLSILTRGYDQIDYGTEVSNLLAYTQPEHDVVIREIAINYCLRLKLINYATVRSLIQGTNHPRWQFAKYCKSQLRTLLQDKSVQQAVVDMKGELNQNEIKQLDLLFKEF